MFLHPLFAILCFTATQGNVITINGTIGPMDIVDRQIDARYEHRSLVIVTCAIPRDKPLPNGSIFSIFRINRTITARGPDLINMVTARTSDRFIQQCNSGESARCRPIFSGSKRLVGVRLSVECSSAGIFLCETSFGVSEQSLDMLPGRVQLMSYSANETMTDVKYYVGSPLTLNCSVFTTLNVTWVWQHLTPGDGDWTEVSSVSPGSHVLKESYRNPDATDRCLVPAIAILRSVLRRGDDKMAYRCAARVTIRNRTVSTPWAYHVVRLEDGKSALWRYNLNVAIVTLAVPFVVLTIGFEVIWRTHSASMRAKWKKNEAKAQ